VCSTKIEFGVAVGGVVMNKRKPDEVKRSKSSTSTGTDDTQVIFVLRLTHATLSDASGR
jgi:hypothetical protein